MVTNCPQQLTATGVGRAPAQGGVLARAATRIRQWFCGMGGHDTVMHFEGKRVMMRCTSCGHDTPGWEVNARGPRRRFDGDRERHVLVTKPRLVARKSA